MEKKVSAIHLYISTKDTKNTRTKISYTTTRKDENHPKKDVGVFLVIALFLLLLVRYSFTFLILPLAAFSFRRQPISLPDLRIVASKLTSKSQSYFARAPHS
jgi:hypothetical protein